MKDKDSIKRLKEIAGAPLPPPEVVREIIDSYAAKFSHLPIEYRVSIWNAISGLHLLELISEMITTDPKTGPIVKKRGMSLVESAMMVHTAKTLACQGIDSAMTAGIEAQKVADAIRRGQKS